MILFMIDSIIYLALFVCIWVGIPFLIDRYIVKDNEESFKTITTNNDDKRS